MVQDAVTKQHGGVLMPNHDLALRILREGGYKDVVEYIQTLEAHNQLLQYKLDRVLSILAEQAADKQNQRSNIVEKAGAVLEYTRDYLSHQH